MATDPDIIIAAMIIVSRDDGGGRLSDGEKHGNNCKD
jgi:hypothetical protein